MPGSAQVHASCLCLSLRRTFKCSQGHQSSHSVAQQARSVFKILEAASMVAKLKQDGSYRRKVEWAEAYALHQFPRIPDLTIRTEVLAHQVMHV
eukprot:829929-Pelagomonas_calceolata.AAC.2